MPSSSSPRRFLLIARGSTGILANAGNLDTQGIVRTCLQPVWLATPASRCRRLHWYALTHQKMLVPQAATHSDLRA